MLRSNATGEEAESELPRVAWRRRETNKNAQVTAHYFPLKVLHYKSIFLNKSETFIARVIDFHQRYSPVAATMIRGHFCEDISVYTPSDRTISKLWNRLQHQLNQSPSFLYHVVERERPDLIHAHFGLDGYRMIGLARHTNLPLVVSFYGHDVSRLPAELGWKYRYKKLACYVSICIAASEAMKQDLIALGFPEDRIVIAKFGLDLRLFRFALRIQAGTRLLLVGRLVEKKGHRYALDALHQLRQQGLVCTLDCYGDGPLHAELKQQATRLGLTQHVRFHGHVDTTAVREALYEHDILLVPSVTAADGDREGMPNTILEGLACGIPTIATRHAGIPEIIFHERTGLLVEERRPDQLAAAIQRLIETPGLVQHVSSEGRRFMEAEHHIEHVVRNVEAAYDLARAAFSR